MTITAFGSLDVLWNRLNPKRPITNEQAHEMKISFKSISLIFFIFFSLTACGSNEKTPPTLAPSPISPSVTPAPSNTPTPSPTPTPSSTPTITPTFTPNPTEIVEAYLSQLGSFLATSHDVDIMDLDIEAGTLQMRVRSHGTGESFLRLTSWQIIQDLAQLLQLLGPNADLLIDIIGAEEYSVALLVLSDNESMGYRSETSRETFNAVQSRSVSNQQWEVLANGYFEEF